MFRNSAKTNSTKHKTVSPLEEKQKRKKRKKKTTDETIPP